MVEDGPDSNCIEVLAWLESSFVFFKFEQEVDLFLEESAELKFDVKMQPFLGVDLEVLALRALSSELWIIVRKNHK